MAEFFTYPSAGPGEFASPRTNREIVESEEATEAAEPAAEELAEADESGDSTPGYQVPVK